MSILCCPISPFCSVKTTITVRQSKSIEDREIGKQFAFCGESWLTSSKFSSLMEMTKVHSSSQRSTLARMSSASKIEEMEFANRCSNLLLLKAGKHLPLFHLSCLSLVFLLMCCNVLSLKPTRPMCDGRPIASPLFRRLAGRGAFLRGFPFRWVLHFVFFSTRSVALHDSPSCYREDSLDECERPCDTLFCLLFSALWLRCNYSILVQETQSVKDPDLTCFTTFPFNAVTCLLVGPMSLDWPVDPFARSDLSRSTLPPEIPRGEQLGVFPASTRSRWRQDALQAQPQILQRTTGWDGCGPFLSEGMRCITWNTRGLVGSVFSRQRNRECKLKYLKRLFDANNNICLQEVHEKDEYLQAVQVLATQFQFFGTFILDNENVGGSAILHSQGPSA